MKCELCSPVYFFPSELWYFENFTFGLSDVEKRIAVNLFNDPAFSVFGSIPNWYHTLSYQAHYLMSRSFYDILNEYACVAIRIFCNVFFENTMMECYNGPQHQSMQYRSCIFLKAKKFILQISAYINRKFFQFFQENACPCVDYNCRYLKILNKRYYEYIKTEREYNVKASEKRYSVSILNYFKDVWGHTFFKIAPESCQ